MIKTILLALVASVSGKILFPKSNAKLDINQKVYIENAPVLGDGAGEGALGTCQQFASSHVKNVDAPEVKVCGTGIKVTAYLRNRCAEYYEHSQQIGDCDKNRGSDSCQSWSPDNNANFGHYQSYVIEQC